MAEGVTYADLRFAKSPPEGMGRPPPGQDAHEEASDGELTYENCPPAAAPRPRGPASPDGQPQAPEAPRGQIWWRVALALLGACLVLLAACLGLGLRYWQVSRQLEGASRRHRAESGALAERMGSQEQNLTLSLGQLAQAQAELGATRLALWQSWQAGNRTQRQLEQQVQQAQREKDQVSQALEEQTARWTRAQSLLRQEKEKAAQELERVRSCQQTGCCLPGWMLFQRKCLWVSRGRKTWFESQEACENQKAQLLILKPWDASSTWDTTGIANHLQSEEFWVGLKMSYGRKREWRWMDGTPYTGPEGSWFSQTALRFPRANGPPRKSPAGTGQ